MTPISKSAIKLEDLLNRVARLEQQAAESKHAKESNTDSGNSTSDLEKRIAMLERLAGQRSRHDVGDLSLRQCALPHVAPRVFPSTVSPDRARLIRMNDKKWLNGTILRFCFMPDNSPIGGSVQKDLVRDGFERWKKIGIGISFKEVSNIGSADVRIGFVEGDGSWSFIGRDIRDIPSKGERTMNFGWDLTEDPRKADVAVHEIGHTLGFPHEHQNPFSGIIWDEAAVIRVFSGPPNNWDERTIRGNILDKLSAAEVQGTQWDPDSIMEYAFPAGVILQPSQYRIGLTPSGGLSNNDVAQAKLFYPLHDDSGNQELQPLRSQILKLAPTQQANLNITAKDSGEYTFQSFGGGDTVMVLFEDLGKGDLHFVAGDDDSGVERNSRITARLVAGRHYVLRTRLFSNTASGELAVMMIPGAPSA